MIKKSILGRLQEVMMLITNCFLRLIGADYSFIFDHKTKSKNFGEVKPRKIKDCWKNKRK